MARLIHVKAAPADPGDPSHTEFLPEDHMTTIAPPLPPLGFGERLAVNLRLWREKRRWVAEMQRAAGRGELDGILNDIGLSRGDLDTLIDAPADAGRQFETYAAMNHVDLHRVDAAELREAEWTCIRCSHADACRHWLRDGIWDDGADQRCPNAELMGR
jgi:hypothetical protein